MTRFVVVPQWQGSPSTRGMLLREGAEAIAGDLPRSKTNVLDVPLEAGDAQGTGIHRLSAVRRIAAQIQDALAAAPPGERVVVVGGDCGVTAAAASAHAGDDLAIVWIDAHADLNTPSGSPSGAFAGMTLRALVGDVPEVSARVVAPERVVMLGARDLDDDEAEYIDAHGIRLLTGFDLDDPSALVDAVRETGAQRVYVHVDLDALDPAELSGTLWGVPFGLSVSALVAALTRLKSELPLVGATIAGFAPASPDAAVDDLGAILRVVGAVA